MKMDYNIRCGLLLVLMIICLRTTSTADKQKSKKYSLIDILPKSETENQLLVEKRNEFNIDFFSFPTRHLTPVKVAVDPMIVQKYVRFLAQKGIKYKLLGDFTKAIPKFFAVGQREIDYESNYYNLNEIYDELTRISEKYSDRCSVETMGKTVENRDLKAVVINSNTYKKKTVVVECGTHSREWIGISFCLWLINKLVNIGDPILDHYQFVVIPVLNPDGYEYTWTEDRFWRKNRLDSNKTKRYLGLFKTKCVGIDINRNFETEKFCVEKSSPDPCDEMLYCGQKPFSASEANAVKEFLTPLKESLFAYFSIHSFSQLWLYPYGYTNEQSKDNETLQKLSEIGVKAIEKMYGTKYRFGSISDTIYPASGSSIDWTHDTLGIKYSFALELRDTGRHGFQLPESQIKPTCEETWKGIEAVLRYLVDGKKPVEEGSPADTNRNNETGEEDTWKSSASMMCSYFTLTLISFSFIISIDYRF